VRGQRGEPGRLAVYGLTGAGLRLAERIAKAAGGDLQVPARLAAEHPDARPFERLGAALSELFGSYDGHVLVAATGVVVRLVAPLLRAKSRDPAVVCLGQDGRHVISLVSGHLGGANDLARSVALITGGQAVVTTATDLCGAPALEVLARDLGLVPESLEPLAAVSRTLVDGGAVPVFDPGGFLWPSLANWPELFQRAGAGPAPGPSVAVDWREGGAPEGALTLRPPALALGLGCHLSATAEELEELASLALKEASLSQKSVKLLATIDSRAGAAPRGLARAWGLPLLSYGREALGAVIVPNPSETVKKNIGVPSVCEAAAILAARGGPLLAAKRKGPRATCAAALIDWT
jgi:cobalt-precorrin 5A hydrolase